MSDRTHQKAQVLAYLRSPRGHACGIDPWLCARMFGHLKLSTVISELRSDGHYIEGVWRESKNSRHLVYHLVKANRKAA